MLRDRTRNCALLGGFGSGKTTGLALKLLQLKTENQDTPGLFVAPNWRTLWSVDYRAIRDVLSRVLQPHEMPRLVDKTAECYLDFGDGVPIFLRSANRIDSFDGVNAGWAVLDEVRYYSRAAYQTIKGRVRVPCRRPQTVCGSTPAFGILSEEFDSGKPNRNAIIAPTHENKRNLAEGFIEDLQQSYSKRILKAYVEGLFCVLEGAVYEDFDNSARSPWLVDFDPKAYPMVESKVYLAVDPGYRRSAWIWILERTPSDWVVFDELMPDDRSDLANVRDVNARGWPIDEIWIDPAARSAQSYEGADTLQAIRQINTRGPRPIRWLEGMSREIAWGVDKTRVLLGCEGHPRRVHFARRLLDLERGRPRGLLRDLAAYRYPELRDGRPTTDIPLKDGITDHFCDAFRYWAAGMWLTDPRLRRIAYDLKGKTSPGYKAAA